MGTLAGKTALVTGASRGIGRAIAQRLGREGALVAVHYGNNEEAARETTAAITNAGGQAFPLGVPLGEPRDAQALWEAFDEAVAEHADAAGVDIIVNNAGIVVYATIDGVGEDDFDRLFAVNVKAPFFIIKEGLGRISDGGRIINISSGAARIATTITVAYSMTKGALNTLSRTPRPRAGTTRHHGQLGRTRHRQNRHSTVARGRENERSCGRLGGAEPRRRSI